MERFRGRLVVLGDLTRRLHSSLEEGAALGAAIEGACDLVGARYGALALVGPSGRIERFVTHGLPEEDRARFPAPTRGGELPGWLRRVRRLAGRRAVSAPPGQGAPDIAPRPAAASLSVTLRLGQAAVGSLHVVAGGGRAFAPEDQELLAQWATQTALALRNAGLLRRGLAALAETWEARAALERSEERFRMLVQNSSDLIPILDPNGRFLYASPSHRAVLGYGEGELLGRGAFDLVHPQDLPRVRAAFAEALRRPGPMPSVEVRLRHLDGSWRVLEVAVSNRLDVPGINGVVVTSRDTTERRQAEEAARRALDLSAAVFDSAHDAVAVIDARDYRCLWLNRRALEMVGLDEEEALGRPCYEVAYRRTSPCAGSEVVCPWPGPWRAAGP